ncbi:MAG: glucosaminidase domain-containing protein [Pseudomonadota bacterium]
MLAIIAAALIVVLAVVVIFEQETSRWESVDVNGTDGLLDLYQSEDYILAVLGRSDPDAPRINVIEIPADWADVTDVDKKKDGFIRTVLPLVLLSNRNIMDDRKRLVALNDTLSGGGSLDDDDQAWLKELASQYGVDTDGKDGAALVQALLPRVDTVPPSLAVAQAAVESGWGQSRFALDGNALFGQWTWSDDGIQAEDSTSRVASFDQLIDSVEAYMLNLNSQHAYQALREKRADQRAKGEVLDGLTLAATLVHYSEEGTAYAEKIEGMIRDDELAPLDTVVLDDDEIGLLVQTRD